MNEEQLRFKMEVLSFEGPLDLLLAIVNKNKMSIYDIEISLLFQQYMEYITRMQDMDMEVAGEFIDMASRLMLIKSRMILPRESDDPKDDPRTEIIDALLEYQKAKEMFNSTANGYGSTYYGSTGTTYRRDSTADDACNCCANLICLDCLCECLGGDLIRCI